MNDTGRYDVVVIGSGAAGLSAALALPPTMRVAVLAKGKADQGATNWAQGGIASVQAPDDSFSLHEQDTVTAGAGLCHVDTVRMVVERAPAAVARLAQYGISLSMEDGRYHLTREGGHSRRRVVHSTDATGRALQICLWQEVEQRRNIDVLEHWQAVELIVSANPTERRCTGVWALDQQRESIVPLSARATVMASGGASGVYLHSTSPLPATGDGIAMAWRAGCRVANMEFTQFHPTCLYKPDAEPFLISEALRGEGARLVLPDGTPFMAAYHRLADLAPRDVVARAIHQQMSSHGLPCVYLDLRHLPAVFVREHFPTIHAHCLALGVDLCLDLVPVVPAAHYTCGGIVTDLGARTDVAGLYAAGECAFTGLHGANRLASNSLLECLVFGEAAAQSIVRSDDRATSRALRPHRLGGREIADPARVAAAAASVRRLMWRHAGIVRTLAGLEGAREDLSSLERDAAEWLGRCRPTEDVVELNALVTVADLVVRSALARRESRGAHYVLDYPDSDPAQARDTILEPTQSLGRRDQSVS